MIDNGVTRVEAQDLPDEVRKFQFGLTQFLNEHSGTVDATVVLGCLASLTGSLLAQLEFQGFCMHTATQIVELNTNTGVDLARAELAAATRQ